MRGYTLVDCDTGLIYGPYESYKIARACAAAEALTTWEIVNDDEKLVDWNHPTEDVSKPSKREVA
jgi:hypothetical protein